MTSFEIERVAGLLDDHPCYRVIRTLSRLTSLPLPALERKGQASACVWQIEIAGTAREAKMAWPAAKVNCWSPDAEPAWFDQHR